ncbi:MAG: iron-sulfur cluster assembly protein [Bacteroidales bacterium]|jgi:FeS assembly SUF system protein|nr:iron-sulfur cluster assembly protein [Bacteroidales bacterium]
MKTDEDLKNDIITALKQVYDPEISVNIYDLGLIYEIKLDENKKAFIKMTLTAPNCPIAYDLVEQVNNAVKDVPGVTDAAIALVFDPAWDKSMMSEEAKAELGFL